MDCIDHFIKSSGNNLIAPENPGFKFTSSTLPLLKSSIIKSIPENVN